MKITHYICPRACGKTTYADSLKEANPNHVRLFKMMDKGEPPFWRWGMSMRGERYKKVIMDEYIFRYTQLNPIDRHKFIEWLYDVVLSTLDLNEGELILLSTADKQYSSELILLAMMSSYDNLPDNNLTKTDSVRSKISEVKNKFLVPSPRLVEVIKWNEKLFGNSMPDSEKIKLKSYYSKEQYEINIENNFIV